MWDLGCVRFVCFLLIGASWGYLDTLQSPKEVPFVWAALCLNQNWKNRLIFVIFSRLFLLRLTKHLISLCDLSLFWTILFCAFFITGTQTLRPSPITTPSFTISFLSPIFPASPHPLAYSEWKLFWVEICIYEFSEYIFLCSRDWQRWRWTAYQRITKSAHKTFCFDFFIVVSDYTSNEFIPGAFRVLFIFFFPSVPSSSFLSFMSNIFLSLPTSTYFLFILKNI